MIPIFISFLFFVILTLGLLLALGLSKLVDKFINYWTSGEQRYILMKYKVYLITTWFDLLGITEAIAYIRWNQATSTNPHQWRTK